MKKNTYKTKAMIKKLGAFIRVEPICSERSGEAVRNQYELVFEHGYAFQSYSSIIGICYDGRYYFSDHHDFSVTTSKYCNYWCGRNGKERREGLKNGKYGFLDSHKISKY